MGSAPVEQVLTLSAAVTRQHGWVSAACARHDPSLVATARHVLAHLDPLATLAPKDRVRPLPVDQRHAAAVVGRLRHPERRFERRLATATASGFVRAGHVAPLAWLVAETGGRLSPVPHIPVPQPPPPPPPPILPNLPPPTVPVPTRHLSRVGARGTFDLTLISRDEHIGEFLRLDCLFRSRDGDLVSWDASTAKSRSLVPGCSYRLTGTVSGHVFMDGHPVTRLRHVRLTGALDDSAPCLI